MTQIYSMTGFGSSRDSLEGESVSIEIKSVNSRFLDINYKIPYEYVSFEQDLGKLIKAKLGRGRVDLYLKKSFDFLKSTTSDSVVNSDNIILNEKLVSDYLLAADKLEAKYKTSIPRSEILLELLKRKDIFINKNEHLASDSPEILKEKKVILDLVSRALDSLVKQRKFEGQELSQSLTVILDNFESLARRIKDYFLLNKTLFKEKLLERFRELKLEIEESRLEEELAILVERSDITEELDRLKSHIAAFKDTLSLDPESSDRNSIQREPAGRKLEFLLQEMSREVNTIGSKAKSYDISSDVVEAKSLLEKLREQVLNIE